jgi:hypothetical protein
MPKVNQHIRQHCKSILQKMSLPLVLMLYFFTAGINQILAQQTTVSITASATVIDKKEIELITIHNLEIDETMANAGIIYVSAKMDPLAGKMLVKGKAGEEVRINFQREVLLFNSGRQGQLVFTYNICGYKNDNQSAADIFTTNEQTITLNEKGEYYIWIGGRIDISGAIPGHYTGEFTFEIEYIE